MTMKIQNNKENSKYKFTIFIMSYNRCDFLFNKTLKLLKKYEYTGDWYVVVDDNDPQLDKYKKRIPENKLLIYNKKEIGSTFDNMDNFGIQHVVAYPRNFINQIVKTMDYDYYLVLDDDYIALAYKKDDYEILREKPAPKKIDKIIEYMIEFLENSNIHTVCLAQAGDYIGGMNSNMIIKGYSRKCMNSFFAKKETNLDFIGHINEDVNTYIYYGSLGKVFLTYGRLFFRQEQTQLNKGGMSEIYINNGTYLKSFYSKMIMPSCIDIVPMGQNHLRIHHNVKWNNCVPMIIDERWKK